MGIKIVSMQGYEGDDILGTLAKRFDDECIIVTGDRDSFQLVSPTTRVFWTKRGVTDIEVYDEARLLQDGFTTSQFIDYKALMGDASDNIPGIAGVGEKTAKALLAEYGSLDSVLEHAAEIKGKVGQNVVNGREMALLSRRLARINTDVPVECTLDDISFTPIYSGEVKSKLMELEISSLMNRMTFDANEVTPEIKALEKTVVRLNSTEAIRETLKGESVAVYIDREISFATDSKTEYVIDCAEDLFSEGPYFDDALDCVRQCSRNMRLICYDYKTTSKKYGFENPEFFDVMIAAHLARESMPIKGLAQVLGAEGLENGAAELFAASEKLEAQLTEKGLKQLFYDVEQPLCVVLRNMEQRGVRVSMNKLKELEDKYGGIIDRLSRSIFEKAGCNFNISSPKQLGEVLFDKMGLPHGKKTKTGYSVSEDVLAGLAGKNPIVKDILEYRHYTKLQSTYVVGLQPLINRGRIHTDFNQCITTTGRLSSTNPNLQNIPTRSEEAKDIKGAFLPSEGNVLVSADYSQIELRLLAHMSGDEQLIEAFNKDDDIHAITASQILGIPLDAVTPEQRRDAKAVNFGIIYGISGFGLAENLSIPQYKAKEFISNYFTMHPLVRAYMDGCVSEAREKGYAITLLGRRRNLSDLNASNYLVRSSAERMAMNTPLQGSAADIIKVAMLGVEKRLKDKKSKMILQIHDELIIDTAKDELNEVMDILTEEMQNAAALKVPLVAKAGYAEDWGSLK
jgi:DNA polymerase-1